MADKKIVNPDGTVRKVSPQNTGARRTPRVSPEYMPEARRGLSADKPQFRKPSPTYGERPQPRKSAPTYGEWQKQRRAPNALADMGTRDIRERLSEKNIAPGRIPPVTGKSSKVTAGQLKNALSGKTPAPPPKKPSRPAPDYVRSSHWAMPEDSPLYPERIPTPERTAPMPKKRPAAGKKTVSKEQKERIKAQKEEKRQKRAYYVKAFFVRLLVVFVACLAAFGLIFYRTFFTAKKSGGSIEYYVNFGDKASFTAAGSKAFRNGVMYIDFSALARSLGISSVGSVDSMRFIVTDKDSKDSAGTGKENYVIFTNGSGSAYINGSGIMTEGECFTSGTDMWVPFSFVSDYMRGIVTEKDGSSVTISAEKEVEDEDGNIMIPDITFAMSKATVLEHVEYPGKKK